MLRTFRPPADARIGRAKVGRVGDVVDLGPELQCHLLVQLEVLEDRQIRAPRVRSEELIAGLLARSPGRLWCKSIRAQPASKACIGGLVGLAGDHAGPVGGYGGQIDLRGTVRVGKAIYRLKCLSRLPEEDHV